MLITTRMLNLRIISTLVENTFPDQYKDGGSKDHLHTRREHTKRSLIYQTSLIQIIAFLISFDQSAIKQKDPTSKNDAGPLSYLILSLFFNRSILLSSGG